jgi:hypothetical protein
VFKCSPDTYHEEKEKLLSSLESKQLFNTQGQINIVKRRSQKILKKPWFVKELIGEKTYLISQDDEKRVLVLKEPSEIMI